MNDVQEIDVDELMAEIRANLPQPQHLPAVGTSTPSLHSPVAAEVSALQDSREIRYFHLTSHHKLLGGVILSAKKLARKLLTPSLERQTAYNTANMRLTQHFWKQLESLQCLNHELVAQISELRQALPTQLTAMREALTTEDSRIRQDLATQHAAMREALSTEDSRIRQDLATQLAAMRHEVAAQCTEVQRELVERHEQYAAMRHEVAAQFTEVQRELVERHEQYAAMRHEVAAQFTEVQRELVERHEQYAAMRHEVAAQFTEVQRELVERHEQYDELAEQIGGVHQEQEAGLQAIRAELAEQIGGVQQSQEVAWQAVQGELAAEIGGVHQEQTRLRAQIVDEMTRLHQEHTAAIQEMRERSSRVERRLRRFNAASTAGQTAEVAEPQLSPSHLISIAEHTANPSFDYFGFEERFRGSEEDIKERQKVYVECFKDVEPVLDIGCGRGEFLELAREAGIKAKGVDLDLDMVLYCHEKKLDVAREDAFAYLESIPDASLGGIFAAQVVEHIEPTRIVELVNLCHRKLQMNGVLIVETPNPLCLTVFARSFYMDLTHIRPIHPEAMKFLFESVGFKDLQVKFSAPVEPDMRVPPLPGASADAQELNQFNEGIERLNNLLYGFQDFAVIGRKSSRP